MAPETACQQVLEELLSRRSPTGELAAHLASCPTCQQASRTLQGLGSLPSAWTTPPSAALQQKIMKSVAEAGLIKPRLPENGPAGSLTATSFTIAIAGGALVLALLIHLPQRSGESSGHGSRPPHVASQAISLATPTVSLASPAVALPPSTSFRLHLSDPESPGQSVGSAQHPPER